MNNHDVSISEMIDPEDEAEIGLLGRDPNLQFVRLASAYNALKAELKKLKLKEAGSTDQNPLGPPTP